MAIIKVRQNLKEQSITQDGSGVRYGQLWEVWATHGSTALDATYGTDGSTSMPQYGEQLGTTGLYVRSVNLKSLDIVSGNAPGTSTPVDIYFQFNVEYTPLEFATFDPNPLDRPAEISWEGGEVVEAMMKDWAGLTVANSAGEPFDPLPERYIQAGDCTITRNEESNPASVVVGYSYTTNNASLWSGAVATENALLGKITAQKTSEVVNGATVVYWKVTYPISFRNDNWRLKLLDQGWRYLDSSGYPTEITDRSGNTPTVPVAMDGAGNVQDHTESGYPQAIIYPEDGFEQYKKADWSSLNLPNPFT